MVNEPIHIAMDRNEFLPLVPSACHQAFNILEVLERILFLVPPAQLLTLRFVSRHWDRATYRPLWQYPDFTQRGMDKITPRLVEHGHIVQELDFYKASLFRENPLEDVETLKRLCPNVRSLRMPFGCLTFAGVQHLIQFYGLKSVGPLSLSSDSGEGGQLHTLSLDMSKTEYQPEGMEWLTDLGGGLRRLELRLNRKREGSQRQRTSFLQFEPLLASCGGIRELVILPTPHFLPSSDEKFRMFTQGQHPTLGAMLMDQIHGAMPKLRTSDTLQLFEQYRPSLRLLHLGRVWFSDMDLEVLGRACPNIDDLRLTNMMTDLSLNEWNVWSRDMPVESDDRAKDELSMEVILKYWPGMRVLRLDGNIVRMFSAVTRRNLQAPVSPPSPSSTQPGSLSQASVSSIAVEAISGEELITPSAAKVTAASAGLLPRGSYKISSLCLLQTSLLEEDLATLVDLVEPTLTYLNVDKNPMLTDQSIRHVLMTCSNLRDFSASELDLTMNIFEDDGPCKQEQQQQDIQDVLGKVQGLKLDGSSVSVSSTTKGLEPATKKPWACIKTLRSLDFSWRMSDGQPAHLSSSGSATINFNESLLPPYRHHAHLRHQQHSHPRAQGSSSTRGEDPTTLRMFSTPWQIESIYERLGALERLEVLQLEGWVIPWRAADIEAFLGHSSEPELISKENQFQEDKISSYLPWERYKGMGRWKEAISLNEYKEADFTYIASADLIVKEKLRFQAPNKDASSWQASPGVGGLTVDRADLFPLPTSRMGRLRLLNIMCKKPEFLDNPTGHLSPFVLYSALPTENESRADGDDRQEPKVESAFTSSVTSTLLAPIEPIISFTEGAAALPPPPPPPPPCRGFIAPRLTGTNIPTTVAPRAAPPTPPAVRPRPIPSRRKDTRLLKILTHGIVASFMKACPNLERVMVAYEGYMYVPFHQTDFTVQLGCSEKQDEVGQLVDRSGKKAMGILNDPAAAILRVSPRRVLCTRRIRPELTTLRRY